MCLKSIFLTVTSNITGHKIGIITHYSLPSLCDEKFINDLSEMYTSIHYNKQDINLFVEDINIDLLLNNCVINNYVNLLNESGFIACD